ncbi:MAG: hypothetical protein WCY26_00525 [Thiohalobacteraceae bacterium]
MNAALMAFRAELAAQGGDYLCEDALGGREARLRFSGRFDGEDVVWDAELVALAATEDAPLQYLDIGVPGPRGVPIRIGLAVAAIDRSTLLKTIIMVRNYKRLRRGRHEFGPHGPVARARDYP